MKMIFGERQAGKTEQLIRMAAEDNDIYLVVSSNYEASRVFQRAKEMGLDIRFPMSYDEFLDGRTSYGKGMKYKVMIDNLDLLIKHISKGIPVEGFSLNIEFSEDNKLIALSRTKINQ
jgi:hypothetical protein